MEKVTLSLIGLAAGLIGGNGLYYRSKVEGLSLSIVGYIASVAMIYSSHTNNETLFYLSAFTGLGLIANSYRHLISISKSI